MTTARALRDGRDCSALEQSVAFRSVGGGVSRDVGREDGSAAVGDTIAAESDDVRGNLVADA